MARAKQGGEFVANGEFYKGGRFLNTIADNPKKSGSRPAAGKLRKREVAPYVWEMQPSHDAVAIFSIVGTQAGYVDRYADELTIEPHAAGVAAYGPTAYGYDVAELCTLWNDGQRWIARK